MKNIAIIFIIMLAIFFSATKKSTASQVIFAPFTCEHYLSMCKTDAEREQFYAKQKKREAEALENAKYVKEQQELQEARDKKVLDELGLKRLRADEARSLLEKKRAADEAKGMLSQTPVKTLTCKQTADCKSTCKGSTLCQLDCLRKSKCSVNPDP